MVDWKEFERLESLAILALAFFSYFRLLDGNSPLFLILALAPAPHLSMAGYLFLDSEKATALYNAFHNYTLPAAVMGYYLLTGVPLVGQVALIWTAHIAADRTLGYGLKTDYFNQIEDSDFNGALVEASDEINQVGLCTNTTFENIESASELDYDLVISHHGGWKRFDMDLFEDKKREIRDNNLTWYIAHQTLDCADEYGVCVALADKLGIEVDRKYCELQGGPHGRYGHLEVSKEDFLERLNEIEPS